VFELDGFIAELRAALVERSRQPMRDIVGRAVSHPESLMKRLGAPDRAGVQVLHRAADLTVLNVTWAPEQITLPHNHNLTAIIGMYSGREDNVYWRRVSGAARYPIEPRGGCALGAGEAVLLGRELIHSVINPLGRISGAIHVYDGDFFAVQRSMWDAESLTEAPYDLGVALKGMQVG
jgi:predicted metal-dependent enzyme (double-stranded beta helix superfamily)